MIVLVGPSGSGKSELAKSLFRYKNMSKVITATTRKARIGEVNLEDYYFLSEKKFDECVKENKFIETTSYNGYRYGTPIKELRLDKVLIIGPEGLKKLIEKAPSDLTSSICVFYIKSKKDFREKRLLNRGFTLEEANRNIIEDNYIFKNIDVNFVIDVDRVNERVVASKIYLLYQLFLNNEFAKTPKKIIKTCAK